MSRFIFEPAADESVDDQYVLEGTEISIQVSPYADCVYTVNEWLPDEQAMVFHGEFKSLRVAKLYAKAVSKREGKRERR